MISNHKIMINKHRQQQKCVEQGEMSPICAYSDVRNRYKLCLILFRVIGVTALL